MKVGGGGRWGMGAGEVQKIFTQGKLNEKSLCTPINPKKYSCYGLKKFIQGI